MEARKRAGEESTLALELRQTSKAEVQTWGIQEKELMSSKMFKKFNNCLKNIFIKLVCFLLTH